MTRVRLALRGEDEVQVVLAARVTFASALTRLHYPTRTGALLRIDGAAAGAFDGRHRSIDLATEPGEHEIVLEVERRALPASGLPSGDGARWRLMLARAAQDPPRELAFAPSPAHYGEAPEPVAHDVPLAGHAHLDVAWLWTYGEAKRKAVRTFATALRQLDLDPRFRFVQSQPQLYAWVAAADAALFERVRARAGAGFDTSVAALWVEPDLHALSGESILRQFALGVGWMEQNLGVRPDVAWLPDTFGFPATFPQLAAHAGMRAFATTKLQWNESTRWPWPQFRWFGDDGSSVCAAVIDAYEGPADERREETARDRREPLLHGYGDGGGNVPDDEIAARAGVATPWTSLGAWFDAVDTRILPVYRGELYLETHRGTYTTHRDVKARNAALESALEEAEELLAWCVAVRVPPSATRPLAEDLRTGRTILARNQFHDVLAGTATRAVYAEVRTELERVERIAARVAAAARAILPRADVAPSLPVPCAPQAEAGEYVFANDYVRARVRSDGTIVELTGVEGPNLVALANGLRLFVDRPRSWDAWNLDAGYDRRTRPLRPAGAAVEDGTLVVRLAGDGTAIAMSIALCAGEPWLRVELAVRWEADHRLLRAEHRFALATREVRFGQPHGSLVRPVYALTDAERARFEVPAQRFVHLDDGRYGVAILAPDSYGWSAQGLDGGGVRVGTSLLRAPRWPDPGADRGEHRIAYALAPTAGASIGALELAWRDYVEAPRVRLFACDDPAVLVVATKPADDGDGTIVRVRECDGAERAVALRCGGRIRSAEPVDGCERPVAGEVLLDGEALHFVMPAFSLRSFRVRS